MRELSVPTVSVIRLASDAMRAIFEGVNGHVGYQDVVEAMLAEDLGLADRRYRHARRAASPNLHVANCGDTDARPTWDAPWSRRPGLDDERS